MESGIYKIVNVVDGKMYIGRSKNVYKRVRSHKCDLRKNRHGNQHLQNAWNKYGEENFMWEIVELCSLDIIEEKESYWIKQLDTLNRDCGYNIEERDLQNRYTNEYKQHLSKLQKVNMLAYHEKQRNNGKYTVRVYDLVTGEYEIFPSTKDCPYSFKKNGDYNFRIGKCKLDNNLTELELQEKYNQFKIRYENALISQSSQTAYVPIRKEIYSHQYSTIWRSDDETLYFKTNKEAAAHFNLHLSTVSICVKKQKYKRFYVEKQGTGGN